MGSEVRLSADGKQFAFGLFEQPLDIHRPTVLAVGTFGRADIRQFRAMPQPSMICWSPTEDRIALWSNRTGADGASKAPGLWILQVDTGEADLINAHGSVDCPVWSPDGVKLVYTENGTVNVYDTTTKTSLHLADGDSATWSPNGKWVAVSRKDSYSLIDPATREDKLLFKQKNAFTPLWWSPDSQYVAYATRAAGSLSAVGQVDLWVRRVQDGTNQKIQRVPFDGTRGQTGRIPNRSELGDRRDVSLTDQTQELRASTPTSS